MAGGIGSRLWPLSTPDVPKQFIDVLGVGRTLIQLTADRFAPVCRPQNFWVVTGERYVSLVREQLPDIPADQILAEPEGRNTAPCIAYASWKIQQKDPEANIVVTPADALVLKTDAFADAIRKALAATEGTDAIVTVEGEGGQHPMDGWGESRIFYNQMPRTGIARTALERTLRKIGQRPAPSGRYRMILESPCAGNFLQPILNAMNGQALQQRTSFLAGKLGEQVVSPLVNIIDDPLQPGTRGASLFDYDGVATQRRELFTEGRLMTYFIDTPMSKKLGMEPTTQGIHRLIMESTAPSPLPLWGSATKPLYNGCENEALPQRGSGEGAATILVTDFNGGNCDPVTGNFSYGIEGFLIENGSIIQPVSGMNITGNILDVWQRLSHVADDADPWETELIPSLTFEDVSFGGC